MENQADAVSRKKKVNLACNLCKKRHIKCDGSIPCIQCVSRNEECVFGNNNKRGRKSTKEELIVTLPSPQNTALQISPLDESYHPAFVMKFVERMGPMFPFFEPKCYSIEVFPSISIKIADGVSWSKIMQMTPSNSKNKSLSELLAVIEYTMSCAFGSRLCNTPHELSDIFIAKAESMFQLIGNNYTKDCSLISQLVLLHLIVSHYYHHSKNCNNLHLMSYHNFQAYSLYNAYKQYVPQDIANRLFLYLGGSISELEDTYHYVKKIKLTDNPHSNYINIFTGFSYIGMSVMLKHKNENLKLQNKLFTKFLQLMRECEKTPAPSALPWMPLNWEIGKTFLCHKLQLPLETDPLILLKQVMEIAPWCERNTPNNPGVYKGIVWLLMILPKHVIPVDMWNWSTTMLMAIAEPKIHKLLSIIEEEPKVVVEERINTDFVLDEKFLLELVETDVEVLLNPDLLSQVL